MPECPDFLDDEGKAEWRRLGPLLEARGTVYEISRGALAGVCQKWSDFVFLSKKTNDLKATGYADPIAVGKLAEKADLAYRSYLRGANEFGLTPASRTRIRAASEAPAEENDKSRFFAS